MDNNETTSGSSGISGPLVAKSKHTYTSDGVTLRDSVDELATGIRGVDSKLQALIGFLVLSVILAFLLVLVLAFQRLPSAPLAAVDRAGVLTPVAAPRTPEAALNDYLASISGDPLALRIFLREFPKGADLHSHLSGAVYAETYIKWAVERSLCVAVEIHFLRDCPSAPAPGAAANAAPGPRIVALSTQLANDTSYRYRLIDALSVRNYVQGYGSPSGADQFFVSFEKFGAATTGRDAEMLVEVLNRAGRQHVSYVEIMLFPDSTSMRKVGTGLPQNASPAEMEVALRGLSGFAAQLESSRQSLDNILRDTRILMNCDDRTNRQPGCDVTLRILAQALRNFPNDGEVFALLLACFMLADSHDQVVGVNFVMREDGEYSLARYERHMAMFKYLNGRYPNVNLSLHAGELTMGLVPPEDLRNHISQALDSGARRIGHGIDIAYEERAEDTLARMQSEEVLVEINLTSNDRILGVSGAQHPFMTYVRHGVPVALSTDDEGVLRIDLTHEYVRAVMEYQLNYSDLKQLARNALAYSFAEPAEKASLLSQLEADFTAFEIDWRNSTGR